MSMHCYTNATSATLYVPWLPVLLLLQFLLIFSPFTADITVNAIAISNLDADATAKYISDWSIDRHT